MVHHRVVPVSADAESVRPAKLSTGSDPQAGTGQPVDDFCTTGVAAGVVAVPQPAPAWHLGLVVPKRHAKRAVTRTLVKRLIRAGMQRHLQHLVAGDWVLRLRAPIDRKQFPSARSDPLADVLRAEIETLLVDAARRARRATAATTA